MTKNTLIKEYRKDSTEEILNPGTHVNDSSARIYQTAKGIYIGVICERGNLEVIAEMSEKAVKRAERDLDAEDWASCEAWMVLSDAINRAAGNDNYENYEN